MVSANTCSGLNQGQTVSVKIAPKDDTLIYVPIKQWLILRANKLRSDFARFYRDTEKDRIRFNVSETPDVYVFKIKFTPSHRVLKFIIQKKENCELTDDFECQCYEKTNNIIKDINQIYKLVSQVYIPRNDDHDQAEQKLLQLWYWGMQIMPERKHDIYKVPAEWFSRDNDNQNVLYVAIINKITPVKDKIDLLSGLFKSFDELFNNTNRQDTTLLELELLVDGASYTHVVEVQNHIAKNIFPRQIFISNWMSQYAIMRFTPAKHHLIFTPQQYEFIAEYLSKDSSHD